MKKIPEIFFTTVRKVEPIGGDCVRLYCSVERNGAWEDRVTLEMPIAQLIKNTKFITEAAADITAEKQMAIVDEVDYLQTH
ncbi:hypothetical protein JQ600_35645 [Bradyrhizobium sp. AUGA SZCCT0176]|uniref:hypothetical protein n=1 Tax=Bradyrhizobium sp. AUGA SZCCT0176 TaxID=2807664 RepID=UPI001BA7B37E|nr:hypothetical protein [Bradyrhizobium sp. AUGA SZCCT0176]MBR1230232.1 hypothetical protein [Bradyrhizobium sp. AUGA SZCCT0176]